MVWPKRVQVFCELNIKAGSALLSFYKSLNKQI